jgi:hypothetical protein
MIGDVIGGANEIVKAHDRRAMAGRKNGRDGKILVAMGFAGTCVGDLDHAPVNALLRTREQDKLCRFVVRRSGISPIIRRPAAKKGRGSGDFLARSRLMRPVQSPPRLPLPPDRQRREPAAAAADGGQGQRADRRETVDAAPNQRLSFIRFGA